MGKTFEVLARGVGCSVCVCVRSFHWGKGGFHTHTTPHIMDSTRPHPTQPYEIPDPVLRFVQASVIEPPPTGTVDQAVPKVLDMPTIECTYFPITQQGQGHSLTHHAPMICTFARGREAPLGTYLNKETGSIITCTGNRQNFLCQLKPTYDLAEAAPGGFVVSLSDRGPSIQSVSITRSNPTIPLFIRE